MAFAEVGHVVVDRRKHLRTGEEFQMFFGWPHSSLQAVTQCGCVEHKVKGENSHSRLYGYHVGTQVPSRLLLLPPTSGTQLETRRGESPVLGARSTRAQSRGENGSSEAVKETYKYPGQLS